MKKGWFSVAVLLFLGGCSQVASDGACSIDRVHVVLNDETSTLGKVSVVINDPSSVAELVEILDTAKRGDLVRDDELLLAPAVFYELYDGDDLVQILMFNGEDTLRLFRGGLCFEVEYEGVTLSDWYKKGTTERMRKVLLEIPTHEEVNYIDQSLMAYNHSRSLLQTNPFIPVNRCLKNENGEVIAGFLATLVCWHVLYVDVLWVDPRYRRQGYGSQLLAEAEKVAKALGGYLVHLSTFDFQAKAFYLMCGYEIFGVLEDCPRGHLEYFLKKKL